MKRETKRLGAGVAGALVGCVLAIGCSSAPASPEGATGTATERGGVRPEWSPWTEWSPYCSTVNPDCETSEVYWRALTQAERDLMAMGCDYPSVESVSGLRTWSERYTSCPSQSAAVASWVAQHAGTDDPKAFEAHFNDGACDACIPRLPYGRDYVFYNGFSAQPLCQGCPASAPPPW